MSQIRENKHKHLTSHRMAVVLMRTGLPARMFMVDGLGTIAGWRKEAAP